MTTSTTSTTTRDSSGPIAMPTKVFVAALLQTLSTYEDSPKVQRVSYSLQCEVKLEMNNTSPVCEWFMLQQIPVKRLVLNHALAAAMDINGGHIS